MNKEQFNDLGLWGGMAAIATVIISYIWHHPFLIHLEMGLTVTQIVIGMPVEFLLRKGFRWGSEKNEERKFNIDSTSTIISSLAGFIPALLAALTMDNSVIDPAHPVFCTVVAGLVGGMFLGYDLTIFYYCIKNKISRR